MKTTIIGHASVVVETSNACVVVDPIFDNVFASGTLEFFPAREIEVESLLRRVTAIAVTHAHLDHFHPETLERFDRALPIIVPEDELILDEMRRLGFRNVVRLQPWERHRLQDLELCATPSEFEWSEFGLVFKSNSGSTYWHMSDSIVDRAVSEEVLNLFGPINLLAAKYQPVRTLVAHQRGLSGAVLDKREVADALEAACAARPSVVFPFAYGFAFHGPHAWANRHIGPFEEHEIRQLLTTRLNQLGARTARATRVNPGDVFTLKGSKVEQQIACSELVRMKTTVAPARWEPIDATTLHGVEQHQQDRLGQLTESVLRHGVLPWIEDHLRSGTGLFEPHRLLGAIYQLQVHCGDGRAAYFIDFRGDSPFLGIGEHHPNANLFSHVSGRSLLAVLEQREGPEVFWMAGGYRQYEKIMLVGEDGIAPPPLEGWELLELLPDPLMHYLRKVGTTASLAEAS